MFDCNEDFSKDQLEKIIEMVNSKNFYEINSVVNICDLNQSEEKVIKNIKEYIWIYLSNMDSNSFSVSVNNFIMFVENYSTIHTPQVVLPSLDGKVHRLNHDLLVICNGYHIHGDFRYMKQCNTNGLYMNDAYLGSDHKIYLSKKSMLSRSLPVSDNIIYEVDYNSLLAESVFNYFSQPVANYYLLKDTVSPFNVIFTLNFLKDNQELIHLSDLCNKEGDSYVDTHTNRLKLIKDNLAMRYKNTMDAGMFQDLIKKIELQYCIQSFLKLLIGPMDANYGNTAIILTHENNAALPSIDLSPAYDLDISFNIASDLAINNKISQINGIDGQPLTIMSFLKEFKNIEGFKGFIESFVDKISYGNISEEIIDDVYKRTNFDFFIEKKNSYASYLNKRFIEVLQAYKKVFLMEVVDETVLGGK